MSTTAPPRAELLPALAKTYLPKGGRAEVATAGLVLAVVLAMILPVPPWMLDVLIATSISVAALMIVTVLQIRESTHLSAFPSLLLLTTLMRIAISIASTRQILLEGTAGHIIQAFGEVVVGGNLVVGLVVYLILTAVQFLVITKGSERVAEVGARFALDAMPGKQLAIDMEMKAGNATPEETRARRAALARESQFHGAMDGAMKFVKGDAIAGILIILINLIGGMTIGVAQRGMPAADAAQVYSILSVGDGLVAQIPALLMSVSAGILITRVESGAGEEGARAVGKELAAQLLSNPRAWITASIAIMLFGLVPGMPTSVFLAVGCGALAVGVTRLAKQLRREREVIARVSGEEPELREFIPVRAFSVRIGAHLSDPTLALQFVNLARQARNLLAVRYGLVLPAVEHDANVFMENADVEFCSDEIRVFALRLTPDLVAAECDPELPRSLGFEPHAIESGDHLGRPRCWVPVEAAERLQAQGVVVHPFWRFVEQRLLNAFCVRGPRYFGLEQGAKLLKWIATKYPEMGKELERVVPVPRLVDVLQRLLAERVSIRNVYTLAQALVEWGGRERDPAVLCECVRAALSRDICQSHAVGQELRAFLVEVEFENMIRGAVRQTVYGDVLDIDQDAADAVLDQFAIKRHEKAPHGGAVILCRQDVRPHVRMLFKERFEDIPVLSLSEVAPEFKVQLLGMIDGR